MANKETDIVELKQEIKNLNQQVSSLDKKLSQHIEFIEKVYMPLQKSIDKFKRIFK